LACDAGAVLVRHNWGVRGPRPPWFNFGGNSFQPSEFAKLAFLVALAWYGEHYNGR